MYYFQMEFSKLALQLTLDIAKKRLTYWIVICKKLKIFFLRPLDLLLWSQKYIEFMYVTDDF